MQIIQKKEFDREMQIISVSSINKESKTDIAYRNHRRRGK